MNEQTMCHMCGKDNLPTNEQFVAHMKSDHGLKDQFAFIKPQLAHAPIEGMLDRANLLDNYVVEAKIDGHRVHIAHHLDGSVSVWSRTGKENGWPAWLYDLARLWPIGTYVDAELFPHPARYDKEPPYTSADVTHLRAENPTALQVFLIDALYYRCERFMHKPFHVRYKVAAEAFARGWLNDFEDYVAVPDRLSESSVVDRLTGHTARDFLEKTLTKGHEGVIVKKRSGAYRPGSRSKDWSKYKNVREVDVLIVGHETLPNPWRVRPGKVGTDGKFYREGQLSQPAMRGHEVLSYGYWDGRSMVRVGTVGMSDKPEKLKQFIGRVATFKVYGVFPDTGALRHPVFIRWRDDIDGRDISKEEIVNGW